ncbi:unnamed protein product, partial [marine sediment metagenome]
KVMCYIVENNRGLEIMPIKFKNQNPFNVIMIFEISK